MKNQKNAAKAWERPTLLLRRSGCSSLYTKERII